MSTSVGGGAAGQATGTDVTGRVSAAGPRLDRIVAGVVIGVIGVGWLLDGAGASVPWRMFPAAALVLIGCVLLVSLFGGRGRGALISMGIVATVLAVAVGVGVDRYAGPAGDRMITPTAADWPVNTQVSVGNVTVDLTRYELPKDGFLQVDLGAGELRLILPAANPKVGVDTWTTAGTVTVDDVKVGDGVDVRWSDPAHGSTPIRVEVHVGMGNIEVSHE